MLLFVPEYLGYGAYCKLGNLLFLFKFFSDLKGWFL